jgi:hypothetical protein
MRELARRCERAKVGVISAGAHPGSTRTELQRHSELMHGVVRYFAQDAPAGALPTLYAAAADGVRGGDYYGPMFGDGRPAHARAHEPARARRGPGAAAVGRLRRAHGVAFRASSRPTSKMTSSSMALLAYGSLRARSRRCGRSRGP